MAAQPDFWVSLVASRSMISCLLYSTYQPGWFRLRGWNGAPIECCPSFHACSSVLATSPSGMPVLGIQAVGGTVESVIWGGPFLVGIGTGMPGTGSVRRCLAVVAR